MNHTPQIKKAIQFAAKKHHGQMRREAEPLPYVTHLFSTALLVAEGGADDDVVIAALLHDTLEDTETTREELVTAFNERIASLVESVSEPREKDGEILNWKERKTIYLENLEASSNDAVRIAVADKIDNIESKLEAFAREGKTLLERWSQPATEYIWYHGVVLKIALQRLPEHSLTKRLREVHTQECAIFSKS